MELSKLNMKVTKQNAHFFKWLFEWDIITRDLGSIPELREFIQVGKIKRKWQQFIELRQENYIFLLKDQLDFYCHIASIILTKINK